MDIISKILAEETEEGTEDRIKIYNECVEKQLLPCGLFYDAENQLDFTPMHFMSHIMGVDYTRMFKNLDTRNFWVEMYPYINKLMVTASNIALEEAERTRERDEWIGAMVSQNTEMRAYRLFIESMPMHDKHRCKKFVKREIAKISRLSLEQLEKEIKEIESENMVQRQTSEDKESV